jgi:anthranilate synthase component 1
MKHYHPNFEEFRKLSEKGNTIPVYRQLLADVLTPVTAYQRLAAPEGFAPASYAFLLESVVGGERIGQYSFVGADPEVIFLTTRNQISITRTGRKTRTITSSDPLVELSKLRGGRLCRLRHDPLLRGPRGGPTR